MKRKYSISGIDCANCAAKLEAKMNELPEVDNVVLTFATGQLLVEAPDLDKALPALRKIADKIEPGTIIEELKRIGKNKSMSDRHSNKHEECGCHVHEGEHEHRHVHEGCSCHVHEGDHEHRHVHEECGHIHEGEHQHKHGHEECSCHAHKEDHEHRHVHEECGHIHEGEHQHKHEYEECNCHVHEAGHEHIHDLENKQDVVGNMHLLDEKKDELISIGAGIVFFIAGLVIEHFTDMNLLYAGVFIVSYLVLGGEVLLTAVKNISRGKVFDENFLMGIATIGALVIGEYPEAAGVMLFYRVGELFEDIAVGRSRKQIMEAVDMRPETARLVDGDRIVQCSPEEVEIGDIIEVRVGDRIPLDGEVIKGKSRIDTSAVTGEPVPVAVDEGTPVLSGCVNVSNVIYIKTTKLLEESMVSRILEAVENAAASKPKIDRFITKFASIYTPLVVLAAVLTAVVPSLITGDWEHWIYTALTFLVISCPCALVLSVPLAFFAGIGAGSKKGILFKGGVSLETLAGIKAVVMDKTGTVTEGNFTVAEIIPDGISEEQLLAYAGSAEKLSTHPIAVSIMKEVHIRGVNIPEVLDTKEVPGKGMEVSLQDGKLLCGNRQLLENNSVKIPAGNKDIYGTEVFIAFNGKYAGCIIINDTIKKDSKQAVADMRKYGLWTAMITGDSEENARNVANITGIDEVYAKQMPEDKINNLVKIREKHGAVMFTGDGINDAPVLAGADVGAAMGNGADAAIEAADVVFMNPGLGAVPESIRIAKETRRIAMENVIGALVIKACVMVLGFAGIASMWMAVFADSGVAMLCVVNAIRILFRNK